VKLNLGCSLYKIDGFVNIDSNPSVNPDVICEIPKGLEQFKNNSIELIYMGHFLEHLNYTKSLVCLRECYRILAPQGQLMVVSPDVDIAYMSYLNKKITFDRFQDVILGNELDHKQIFTISKLYILFSEAGFKDIALMDLYRCPYILVPDINNPIPEPIQSGIVGKK